MYVIYLSILLSSCCFFVSPAVSPYFVSDRSMEHVVTVRSGDELAIALGENPEYDELFDLFVSIQAMVQEQESLKHISQKVGQLLERIAFVRKYISDPLLDEIVQWCQLQKGFVPKKHTAGWKKALIAAAIVAVGIGGGIIALKSLHKKSAYVLLPPVVPQTLPGDGTLTSNSNKPASNNHLSHLPPRAPSGAGSGMVPAQFRWAHLQLPLPRGDDFTLQNSGQQVGRIHELRVACDAVHPLPFFTLWTTGDGQEITGNVDVVSAGQVDQIPAILSDFFKSQQLGQFGKIIRDNHTHVEQIGVFLSRGRVFIGLKLDAQYSLWEAYERVFIPVDLPLARNDMRLDDEVINPSTSREQQLAGAKKYRQRRFVYLNQAHLLFYTSDRSVIEFILKVL